MCTREELEAHFQAAKEYALLRREIATLRKQGVSASTAYRQAVSSRNNPLLLRYYAPSLYAHAMTVSLASVQLPQEEKQEEIPQPQEEPITEQEITLEVVDPHEPATLPVEEETSKAETSEPVVNTSALEMEDIPDSQLEQVLEEPAIVPTLSPAPSGVVIGRTTETGEDIYISEEERTSGMHLLGANGTRKTTLLTNMFLGDIHNGLGGLFVDVDGDSTNEVLTRIPEERMKDVVLLDLSELAKMGRYIGINPLSALITDADPDAVVDRYMHVFMMLFNISSKDTPRLVNTLRASLLTLAYNGLTLSELPLLLGDKKFRKRCIDAIPNTFETEGLRSFWKDTFNELYVQDQLKYSDSTLNKVLQFLMVTKVLYAVSQNKTSVNFRNIMDEDEQKIVLLKLSAQEIGETAARFLGAFHLAELKNSLFSRADVPASSRPYFSLYADEWHLYVTSDFKDILTRGRKYGIKAAVANQTLSQLDEVDRAVGLNKALRGITEQVNIRVTFAVNEEDASTRAAYYADDPQPEYKEQEKKLPVTRPINYIVNGGVSNTSEVVTAFAKRWDEVVRVASEHIREGVRGGDTKVVTDFRGRSKIIHTQPQFYSNRDGIEHIRLGLDLINGLLYEVMRSNNPYQVVPLELITWMAEKFELPFFGREEFQQMTVLITMFPEEQNVLYNNLWLTHETHIEQALKEFAEEAYKHFYTVIFSMLRRFRASVDIEFRGDDDDNQTKHKRYDFFQKNTLKEVFHHFPLDWFPQEVINTFEWERGKHFPLKYAPHAPNDTSNLYYCVPGWRLVEGQEQAWIEMPKVKEEIDRMFTELIEAFESFVRELREVMQALASSPLLRGSGEVEQVKVGQRSFTDMEKEKAKELLGLPNGTAYVAIRSRGDGGILRMETKHLDEMYPRVGDLQERRLQALNNAIFYTTDATVIKQEVQNRRQAFGIEQYSEPQQEAKQDTQQETVSVSPPATEETQEIEAASALPTKAHAVVTTVKDITPDTYLELLYYFSNVTLKQLVKLAGLQAVSMSEQVKINKREQSRINRLIGEGIVETVEPEATKFLSSGGRAPKVYRLKKKGYDTLQKEKGLKPINQGDFSPHAYKTNEVLCSILQGLKETPYTLVDFTHEKQFRQKPISLGNQGLEPDSWFCFMVNGQLQSVFLEVDLKSESSGKLKEKIRRYLQAIEKKAHTGFTVEKVTVAFINPSGKQADTDRLVRIIEETIEPQYAPYFLVASITLEEIAPVDVLTTAIYKKPFATAYSSLLG